LKDVEDKEKKDAEEKAKAGGPSTNPAPRRRQRRIKP